MVKIEEFSTASSDNDTKSIPAELRRSHRRHTTKVIKYPHNRRPVDRFLERLSHKSRKNAWPSSEESLSSCIRTRSGRHIRKDHRLAHYKRYRKPRHHTSKKAQKKNRSLKKSHDLVKTKPHCCNNRYLENLPHVHLADRIVALPMTPKRRRSKRANKKKDRVYSTKVKPKIRRKNRPKRSWLLPHTSDKVKKIDNTTTSSRSVHKLERKIRHLKVSSSKLNQRCRLIKLSRESRKRRRPRDTQSSEHIKRKRRRTVTHDVRHWRPDNNLRNIDLTQRCVCCRNRIAARMKGIMLAKTMHGDYCKVGRCGCNMNDNTNSSLPPS